MLATGYVTTLFHLMIITMNENALNDTIDVEYIIPWAIYDGFKMNDV